MAFDSIPARLFRRAAAHPAAVAYRAKEAGVWQATTWREYAEQVRAAARSLLALGLRPGDTVAILGFNRPEWCIVDVACMALGGAAVGLYTTSTPPEVAHVLAHSEARFLLVDGEKQWPRVERALDGLPALERVVLMRGTADPGGERVLGWERFLALGAERSLALGAERSLALGAKGSLALGAKIDSAAVDARLEALKGDDRATLIYTSGTTGEPKGIVLSHHNLAATAQTIPGILPLSADDTMLSYLPLAHIAEQLFSIHVSITFGVQIHFAESPEKVLDNLRDVQPTLLFGVPRVWEKLQAGIAAKLRTAPPHKRYLAQWAMATARRAHALSHRGQAPSLFLAAQLALADRLVLRKIRHAVGLSRVRACSSGAAPTSPELVEQLAGLGVCLLETYGQSEVCGPTTSNAPGHTRHGTVGRAMQGLELRIADDGEILVRGPGVFLGYHKDPAATAETLEGGWLHSGDLGLLDAEGYLRITGRRKDLLATAGGKKVAPQRIEGDLKAGCLFAEAVLVGEGRPFLAALLWLEPEAARHLAGRPEATPAELLTDPAVRKAVEAQVARVNDALARHEQVRRWVLVGKPLSQEDGELTPTHKVRRAVVTERLAAEIARLYERATD